MACYRCALVRFGLGRDIYGFDFNHTDEGLGEIAQGSHVKQREAVMEI
jgi:hypothetical protein